jgi:hypothetical protein
MLKVNSGFIIGVCLVVFAGLASAAPRTYRQFKDVSLKEKGQVSQSADQDNLFEYTFVIDRVNRTITRTKIRRLDEKTARDDATVYNVMQRRTLPGSDAGNGGKVLIAVRQDGEEILELGHRFAFTLRVSPFSQVISGVYKRIYDKDHQSFHQRHDHDEK